MTKEDDFETLLRAWGRVYGERPDHDLPDTAHAPDVHPLAVAMRNAPGRGQVIIRQRTTMDRGGQGRRTIMAAAAGIKGLRIVPASFVDPVPCIETKRSVYGMGELSRPVPPEIQRVERAALDLHQIDTLRGLVLRVNYCTLGDHDDKAAKVSIRLGSPVKLKRYRDELTMAKVWMHGRLAA